MRTCTESVRKFAQGPALWQAIRSLGERGHCERAFPEVAEFQATIKRTDFNNLKEGSFSVPTMLVSTSSVRTENAEAAASTFWRPSS